MSSDKPPSSVLTSLSRFDGLMGGDDSIVTSCTVIACAGVEFDELIYQAAVDRAFQNNTIFGSRIQKEKVSLGKLNELLVADYFSRSMIYGRSQFQPVNYQRITNYIILPLKRSTKLLIFLISAPPTVKWLNYFLSAIFNLSP